MKKTNFLKFALTLVMAFTFFGVFAQYPAAINTNYVQVTENTYQTVNLDLTLYVAPDPIYSPSYVAATNTGYNAGSLWTWDLGGLTAAAPWTGDADPIAFNTVVINGAAVAGDYVVSVAEQFGAAGCADLSLVTQTISFLPAPTGTMIGANTSGLWNPTTPDLVFYRCGDGWQDDLNITFTETGVPATYDYYAYSITVTATGYNAAGAVVVGPTDVTATWGTSVAATDATFIDGPSTTFTIPAMDFVQFGGNDVRTKYEFTLATVASRISTLSHVREGIPNVFYADTDLVTYYLNLPPVTGPIYHISNTWAL